MTALGPVISPVGDWPLIGDKPHITVGDVGHLTLDAILADAAVTSGTILVPPGTHTLDASSDRTLKTGLVLQVLKGATISVPAGRTFTINGRFEAGDYPCLNYVTQPQWVVGPRSDPLQGSLVATSSGNLTNGAHTFYVSFVTSRGGGTPGETMPSYWTQQTSLTLSVDATHKQINLTDIPLGPITTGYNAVIGRNIYMTTAGGGSTYRVTSGTTLADNTTTTLTVNVSDATIAGYPSPPSDSTAFYSPVVFSPDSIRECKAIWFIANGTTLDTTGSTDAEPNISAALTSVYNYDTYYECTKMAGASCEKVKLPIGQFLIGHRILVDSYGACLSGVSATQTILKINASFPGAKTDLGFAPIWIGYLPGENQPLRGANNLTLENFGIDISCNNVTNTTAYSCIYTFAHFHRTKIIGIRGTGSTDGPNMRFFTTERYCHDQYGHAVGSAYYQPNSGLGPSKTILGETVATGNGTRGPYFPTFSKYPRSSCTITADPSGSPQVVTGSDAAMEWNSPGLGRDAFWAPTGSCIYFDNVVAADAPIKADYTYTTENLHVSVNGSVWENIQMDSFQSPCGAIQIENTADAGDMHFVDVAAGGCLSFGTLGIGNNSQFDHCGAEMGGNATVGWPWGLQYPGGWHPIIRVTKGYIINFHCCYWDSPDLIYWLDGADSGSGQLPYEYINITGAPNAYTDTSFLNTSDYVVACNRTGNTTLDVLGVAYGAGYNLPHSIEVRSWIVVEDPTNKNRWIYQVSAVSTSDGLTHVTVDPSKKLPGFGDPPATLPATISGLRRISNHMDWFSLSSGSRWNGAIHPVSQFGHVNMSAFRVGLGPPGFAWTVNQQPDGDIIQQVIKDSATGSGTVNNGASGTITLSVSNAYIGAVVFVSPGQAITGVHIDAVRVPTDGTIAIDVTNNSGTTFNGAITWYYGGFF